MKSKWTTLIAAFFGLSVGLVLMGSQVAWAKVARPFVGAVDPTNVSGCTTLSGNGTIYLLTQNITTTGTGNCIVVSGHDDTLDLQGFNITGPGDSSNGDGIRITGSENVIEGFNGTISGFAVGVYDVGANTAGDGINVESNTVGLEMAGSGEATEIWTNFSADGNSEQGVYLKSCGDECSISDFDASNNGADGLLITGSEGPRISIFTALDNGGDGVHVGCTSGCGSNSEVKVGDAPIGITTTPAISGNAGDGVFLDASESSNQDQVYVMNSTGNGGIDLHDASSTCGNNHWVHNNFGTSKAGSVTSPSCIPLSPF